MSTLPTKQEDHEAHNVPQATEHYHETVLAGDVVPGNFPQTGVGGATRQIQNEGSMRDIAERGAAAVNPSNLSLIRKPK